MTDRDIPGFGTRISAKYGVEESDERETILNLIMDYLRSSNLADPTLSSSHHFTSNLFGRPGSGMVTPSCLCGGTSPHRTRWDDIIDPLPAGIGRSYVVTEVALVFMTRAITA